MLIVAQHYIHDPNTFWTKAQSINDKMRADLGLLSVLPSKNMNAGTCIWEGPSANAVQMFIDEHLRHVSKKYCHEVDEVNALGFRR